MIIMINAAGRYWSGGDGGTAQAGDDSTTGGVFCENLQIGCWFNKLLCQIRQLPLDFLGFIIICFYCTSFDQVLEHFLKHGKTKEEEEEEVKFQEALAQKRLEQVWDENNLVSSNLWPLCYCQGERCNRRGGDRASQRLISICSDIFLLLHY